MSTFAAAKNIFDLKDGKVDHLSMQKLLYLSHMIHLGENGRRLVSGNFEAWDYGPVEPALYHKLKSYKSNNIRDIFPEGPYGKKEPEHESMKLVVDIFSDVPSVRLVSMTHREGGAWAKCYKPGVRGRVIPDKLILEEYHDWIK